MNPCDALPQDYNMYYNGCWMRHPKHGVGRVMIESGDFYLTELSGKTSPVRVKEHVLTCWWPRPGAFNASEQAVYVARRAMRNMRKSAVGGEHYYVKWGSPYINFMSLLRNGPNPVPMEEAIKYLKAGKMSSVAVTRDIIIHNEDDKHNGKYIVLFRGLEEGRIIGGSFEPNFSGNPVSARIIRQLEGLS